jgi:hypothetical protein
MHAANMAWKWYLQGRIKSVTIHGILVSKKNSWINGKIKLVVSIRINMSSDLFPLAP